MHSCVGFLAALCARPHSSSICIYGALMGVESVGEHQYLVLENLTHGLKQPCVLDLKMGTQAYDEEATPEKIAREQKKYPPQSVIGFRIVGMRVFRPQHAGAAKGEPWRPAREWCLAVTPETMRRTCGRPSTCRPLGP